MTFDAIANRWVFDNPSDERNAVDLIKRQLDEASNRKIAEVLDENDALIKSLSNNWRLCLMDIVHDRATRLFRG